MARLPLKSWSQIEILSCTLLRISQSDSYRDMCQNSRELFTVCPRKPEKRCSEVQAVTLEFAKHASHQGLCIVIMPVKFLCHSVISGLSKRLFPCNSSHFLVFGSTIPMYVTSPPTPHRETRNTVRERIRQCQNLNFQPFWLLSSVGYG